MGNYQGNLTSKDNQPSSENSNTENRNALKVDDENSKCPSGDPYCDHLWNDHFD